MKIIPEYFASSNSMIGFQSYFDSIYNPKHLEKIYIIKGGPGTGKSSLIKSVKNKFISRKCEMFLCSSDPGSYDGIIIDNKIAVIDGTSPHSTEARFPGVVEHIIDNGLAINNTISKYKDIIINLNDKKSKMYKAAYAYLKASAEIKKECEKTISSSINTEKIDSAIDRFFKQNFTKRKDYGSVIRLTSGITPLGIYNTQSFENLTKKTALIVNGKGTENMVLSKILEKAKEYGSKTSISYDPLVPYSPNALMFTEESLCVVNYHEEIHGEIDYDKYKVFNCERFIDKSALHENKSKLKFSAKCQKALLNEAVKYLKEAQTIHKKLEEIYIDNTNFNVTKENEAVLLERIEGFISNV